LVAGRNAFPRSTLPANHTADLALAPMNGPGQRHYYAGKGSARPAPMIMIMSIMYGIAGTAKQPRERPSR
jgi:hypothetical protein